MINWSLLRHPQNWIIVTLMVLVGLMAFDRAALWYNGRFPNSPLKPPEVA